MGWKPGEIERLFYEDLHELGVKANSMNDDIVTFVVNMHINYTNVCVSKCPICAFHRERGYLMTVEEVLKRVDWAVKNGVRELHIVGSHNPDVGVEYFEDMFRRIRERYPDVVIKALTAAEIHFIAKKEKMSVREVLSRLKDAGLQVMPGGGAEILVDSVRRKICPRKVGSDGWLRIMEKAHRMGIKSNATMLFGHIESYRHRAIHLYKLWRLQRKTGGFLAFIPLVFHPKNTEFDGKVEKTDPVDVLKTVAVSRIVLNNFRSIRAYWVMMGEKLAQIALNYGANDIDGTLMGERIAHSAGASTPKSLTVERLLGIIRGAGKVPAERDTFYNILKIYN